MTPEIDAPVPPCDVRQAAASDVDTVARFNCALALESEDLTLDADTVRAGVQAVLDDPNKGVYYVAEIDGSVVGQLQITYEWTDWRGGWFWWIQSVYVEPDYRRRGLLRALFAHVARLARQQGDVRGLRLYVVNTNSSAIQAYTNLGMARTDYLLYETE